MVDYVVHVEQSNVAQHSVIKWTQRCSDGFVSVVCHQQGSEDFCHHVIGGCGRVNYFCLCSFAPARHDCGNFLWCGTKTKMEDDVPDLSPFL